jgi:type II pantothenate kinase
VTAARSHAVEPATLRGVALPLDVVGVDAGLTLTKIARMSGDGLHLTVHETGPREHVAPGSATVGITGARAHLLAGEGTASMEIDAAARGVAALMATVDPAFGGDFVMALMGTGTAFAAVRNGKPQHLGGTPMGGGSFAGIGRRIAPGIAYAELVDAASRGDRRNVDLMISDAYSEGIGRIGPDLTAAHLSKDGDATIDDVLAGMLNLHGENIAQIASSRAVIAQIRRVVVCGGFAHNNERLVESLTSMAGMFGVAVVVCPQPGYAGAVGAALLAVEAQSMEART